MKGKSSPKNGSTAGVPTPPLEIQAYLGKKLRDLFEDVVPEPLPRRLVELVEGLPRVTNEAPHRKAG